MRAAGAAPAGGGRLAEDPVRPLQALRRHDPLPFDLALQRHLRGGDARLPASVFEAQAPASPDLRPLAVHLKKFPHA
jgi:hypothetical protein